MHGLDRGGRAVFTTGAAPQCSIRMPAGAWHSYALEPAFMRDWAEKYITAIGQSRFRDITYVRNAQVAEVRIGPTRPKMPAACHVPYIMHRRTWRSAYTAHSGGNCRASPSCAARQSATWAQLLYIDTLWTTVVSRGGGAPRRAHRRAGGLLASSGAAGADAVK